jgi:hypothetical protein
LSAALGCKTSELAVRLIGQVAQVLDPSLTAYQDDGTGDRVLAVATALIGELQPTTATEAVLAAQMGCTQCAAMNFLHRALIDGQPTESVDRHVNRAARLMRLFTEQVETMSRLKGKSGQQRVVVEHVTVTAGGQAIVGAVMPSGGSANRIER